MSVTKVGDGLVGPYYWEPIGEESFVALMAAGGGILTLKMGKDDEGFTVTEIKPGNAPEGFTSRAIAAFLMGNV
jgi:hypothetical protein